MHPSSGWKETSLVSLDTVNSWPVSDNLSEPTLTTSLSYSQLCFVKLFPEAQSRWACIDVGNLNLTQIQSQTMIKPIDVSDPYIGSCLPLV